MYVCTNEITGSQFYKQVHRNIAERKFSILFKHFSFKDLTFDNETCKVSNEHFFIIFFFMNAKAR